MFRDGKPRYWIAGYDGKFLVVPALLALCVAGIIWLPKPKAAVPKITPVVPRPMAATVVLQPPAGSTVPANTRFTLSGSAETNSRVQLSWIVNGVELQAPGAVVGATNGVWAFGMPPLKPGGYTIQVTATKNGQTARSGEVSYTSKQQATQGTQTPPKKPATQKPATQKPTRRN